MDVTLTIEFSGGRSTSAAMRGFGVTATIGRILSTKTIWNDCIGEAADECDLKLTPEQLNCLAVPQKSDTNTMAWRSTRRHGATSMGDIEREATDKLNRLQAEFDAYRNDAETAVKRALRQYDDAQVTIGKRGEVLRHGGRTERIQ